MGCCWQMIRSNLLEACAELDNLRDRLRYLETGEHPGQKDYSEWLERQWKDTTEFGLFIGMEHAYHHLNFGWNCRRYPEERVIACARKDYRRWEKFPNDWPELWPTESRCRRNVRQICDGNVFYLTMRIPLDEVIMTLEDVIQDIDATFPECAERRSDPEDICSGRPPMTEKKLADQMRQIYMHMNEAWNSRKISMESTAGLSATAIKRHYQFPRSFGKFWPKKKSVSNRGVIPLT